LALSSKKKDKNTDNFLHHSSSTFIEFSSSWFVEYGRYTYHTLDFMFKITATNWKKFWLVTVIHNVDTKGQSLCTIITSKIVVCKTWVSDSHYFNWFQCVWGKCTKQ